MTALSAQEPSEWDDDPAWSRPDPMTAAELEAALDRVCEHDEPPGPDEVRGRRAVHRGRSWPRSARRAADELLAVEAATTGRRGPGQPGSARVFPGESASSRGVVRPRDAAGRAAWLRGPGGRRRRRGRRGRPVRRGVGGRADRGGVRVGPGRGPRRRPASSPPSPSWRAATPGPPRGCRGVRVHRRRGGVRAGRVPRPGRGPGRPGPDPGTPGCPAPPPRWTTASSPGTRPRSSPALPPCSMTPRPAPPRTRSWTGPAG